MNYLFLLDETTMCSATEPVWTIFGYIINSIRYDSNGKSCYE